MDILHAGEMWAILAALFWAIAVVLFKKAGEEAPPLALNLFKDAVALVCFVPVLIVSSRTLAPSWSLQTWLLVAASGILGISIADTMYFMALNRLGASFTAVVNCLYFPSLALLAHFFLGERVSGTDLVGGGLVVAAILVGAAGRPQAGSSRRDITTGILVGAGAEIVVGVGVILVDGILHTAPVLWTTTFRLLAGTVALVPILALRPERHILGRLFRPSPWWRLAVPASILGAALAMWAWLQAFALIGVSRAAILNQLSTIFIFVLAALVLKEPVTPRRLVAVVLAFAGAALVVLGG
jgi:drug/metabolite transporter (DMT)-like permease